MQLQRMIGLHPWTSLPMLTNDSVGITTSRIMSSFAWSDYDSAAVRGTDGSALLRFLNRLQSSLSNRELNLHVIEIPIRSLRSQKIFKGKGVVAKNLHMLLTV